MPKSRDQENKLGVTEIQIKNNGDKAITSVNESHKILKLPKNVRMRTLDWDNQYLHCTHAVYCHTLNHWMNISTCILIARIELFYFHSKDYDLGINSVVSNNSGHTFLINIGGKIELNYVNSQSFHIRFFPNVKIPISSG